MLSIGLGAAGIFLSDSLRYTHPDAHYVRGFEMGVLICALDVTSIFLWRWAVVLLSLCSLALALFVT